MNQYTSYIDGQYRQSLASPTRTSNTAMPRLSAGKRQKVVEVLVEKPVIVHKYVDVEEEVIIEKPVERRIEKDIIIEKVVEVPVEKVVETEVDIIREEFKEVIVEKEVPFEKIIDIPIQRFVERPVEILKEVEVKVPVHVDKFQDRTFIKPIETRFQEQVTVVEKPVVQHRIADKHVEIPFNRHINICQEHVFGKEFYTEKERLITADKLVSVPVQKPYNVLHESIVQKQVEVPIAVKKVVDKPYEVLKEVIREVPVEVIKENRITVPVNKVVEIPVEKIVEIPVKTETHVEITYETVSEKPVFTPAPLDIPHPVIVEKPIPITTYVENPMEKVVERLVEIPFGKLIELPASKEVLAEVGHIKEVQQHIETTVEVPLQVEKYVEIPREEILEKTITLQKIIEKPKVIPRYVDRIVDKYVDVMVEVPVPKIVEVPITLSHDKAVDLFTTVQKVNYRKNIQSVPMNTLIKFDTINPLQKSRFLESTKKLAAIIVENEKLQAELSAFQEKNRIRSSMGSLQGAACTVQEVERLRRICYELDASLKQKEMERNRLRLTTSQTAELEVFQQVDSSDIPKLQSHIQRIRAENENLKAIKARGAFSAKRNKIGSRVSHQETRRENPIVQSTSMAQSRTSSTGIRRSFNGLASSNIVAAPTQSTYIQQAPLITSPQMRASQTELRRSQAFSSQGGYTGAMATTSYAQPASFSQMGAGSVIRKSHTEFTQTTTTTGGYQQGGFNMMAASRL